MRLISLDAPAISSNAVYIPEGFINQRSSAQEPDS
jgi:hypothetical protein